MKTKNKGQSIVEYVMITILIIFGIVYMGPYVLRSINGHFQLWDDGIQDSFGEHLTQAPANSIPPIDSTCNCSLDNSAGSGTCGGGATSHCSANEIEYDYNCNIEGCNGLNYRCVPSGTCCSATVDEGCGNIPIGQTAPNGSCNFGYHLNAKTCGSTTTYTCVADSSCLPSCQGNASNGSFCPGSENGLTQNYNVDFVGNGSTACLTNGPKCQYYCNPGYVLNASKTACIQGCPVAPADFWVDDSAQVYLSDINGTRGAKIVDTTTGLGQVRSGSTWSGKVNNPPYQFPLQSGANYFLVNAKNTFEDFGTSIGQEQPGNAPQACLMQIHYPGDKNGTYGAKNPLEGQGCPNTGCWHSYGYGYVGTRTGILYYIYVPPNTNNNC